MIRCIWTALVVVFLCQMVLVPVEAQVITRSPERPQSAALDVSVWPPELAYAWGKVALLESADVLQVAEVRARVVQALIHVGNLDQARAATNRLIGLGHYEALARLAQATEGSESRVLQAEAERGFDFLSHRNQEQLVSEMVVLAVPQGWEAVSAVLARCLDVEARLLALGRAAAKAAVVDSDIFDRCVEAIKASVEGLNLLGRRYAAMALTDAVESWVSVSKERSDRWSGIAESASDLASGTPNAEAIYARLAHVFLRGGRREDSDTLFEKAMQPFKETRSATPERMELMQAVTMVAREFGDGRLPAEWTAQVFEEAELADQEWKWEVMIQAGRILHLCDKADWAMKCWKAAVQVAAADPNSVIASVCLALLALESHDAGLDANLAWLREWEKISGGSSESSVEDAE